MRCPTVDLVDAVGAEALSSTNMGWTLGVCSGGLFAIWRRQRSIFVCAGRLLYKLLSPAASVFSTVQIGFCLFDVLLRFIGQYPRLLLGTNMQVILNLTLWCIKYTKWWYTDINVMPPRSLFFWEHLCSNGEKTEVDFPLWSALLLRICPGFCLLLHIILSEAALT